MTVLERAALRRVTTEASMRNCSSGKLENKGTALSTAVETVGAIAAITLPDSRAMVAEAPGPSPGLRPHAYLQGGPRSESPKEPRRMRAARVSSFAAKMMYDSSDWSKRVTPLKIEASA